MSDTRKDLVGRFGPPTNIRKGGTHRTDKRHLSRQENKRQIRREVAACYAG
jgi:hypothetical protein